MDVLDRQDIVADTILNCLSYRTALGIHSIRKLYVGDWFVHLIRSKIRYLYVLVDRGTRVNFTRTQLHKFSRHFFQPFVDKLFNLLETSVTEYAKKETLQIIKNIFMQLTLSNVFSRP